MSSTKLTPARLQAVQLVKGAVDGYICYKVIRLTLLLVLLVLLRHERLAAMEAVVDHLPQNTLKAPSQLDQSATEKYQGCHTGKAIHWNIRACFTTLYCISSGTWTAGKTPRRISRRSQGFTSFIDDSSNHADVSVYESKMETSALFKVYCSKWERALDEKIGAQSTSTMTSVTTYSPTRISMRSHPQTRHSLTAKPSVSTGPFSIACAQSLHHGAIPRELWGEILAAVVYLYNRTPTRVNGEGLFAMSI